MPASEHERDYIIGLDIGTTSVSAVAADNGGRQIAAVTIPHGAAITGLPEGHAEQSPERLLNAVMSALSQVSRNRNGTRPAAVGLCGQMHSTVLLSSDNRPVHNIITWQDKRSLERTDGVAPLEKLRDSIGSEGVRMSGCRMAAGYLGATVHALHLTAGLPAQAVRFCCVADWIGAMLTGTPPVTDSSHAASTGMFDLHSGSWSPDLLRKCGLASSNLPSISTAGVQIGGLTSEFAGRCGLPAGTPVCAAVGDHQAAVIAARPSGPASVLINIGTGGQIVWQTTAEEPPTGLEIRPLTLPTHHGRPESFRLMTGAGHCGGHSIAWVPRTIRRWLEEFGVRRSEDEIWNVLTQPDSDTSHRSLPITEPFFSGTRTDPERRGSISNLSESNLTPAALLQSVLRGVISGMHELLLSAGENGPAEITSVTLSGNAARRHPALTSAAADVFQARAGLCPLQEEAACGAALTAGVTAGFWTDCESGRRLMHEAAAAT